MPGADQIVKEITLQAAPSRVWAAITDYQEFGAWFRVQLDQPFVVGGRSTGRMTYPGAEGLAWLAHVERMDEPELFAMRWYADPVNADEPAEKIAALPTMMLEFRLRALPAGGTHLTITESGFSSLPPDRRDEVMRGNTNGWDIQAQNIQAYLVEHGH